MPFTESPTDAAELQNVLTRYVDSYDGYLQAAAVVESQGFADAFREIAARRKDIVGHVSKMIVLEGEKAVVDGSPEAAVHRWWIRVRAGITENEFKAILEECLRGEKVLSSAIHDALEKGNLEHDHTLTLKKVDEELRLAIQTFKSVIG